MGARLDAAHKRIAELEDQLSGSSDLLDKKDAQIKKLGAEAAKSNKLYYEAMEQINVLDGEIDVLKRELVAARARSKPMPCPKKKAAKASKAAKKRK